MREDAGERMRLHIFEPRYRLLVRRAMEGSRRLGMAAPARGGAIAPIASERPPCPHLFWAVNQ